jgi:transcriptional/translational regulatory protein YebC/TACO1
MMALVMTVMLTLAATAEGANPTLPEDGRLEPVRAHLQQVVDRAQAAGLPSDVIVNKVREGLAKGVAPARIEAAVVRLAENLDSAQRYVAGVRKGQAPASLVRAVAEARAAGVAMKAVDSLVRDSRPEGHRAVEVVTDLSLRGYPSERAAVVVENVLDRDARSLDRVPGTLELIRQDYALSHTEAVDALARGLASADSLQTAYKRTVEDEQRRGNGRGANAAGRGGAAEEGADDSPGKSGLAPGHLKKPGQGARPPGRPPR